MTKDLPLWEDSDTRGEELELEEDPEHYVPPLIDLSDLTKVDETILGRSTVV